MTSNHDHADEEAELVNEIWLAIDGHSVPLHLAIRLMPEMLARVWAYMMRTWNIDLLMSLRPPGFIDVAMTVAGLVAELMADGEPEVWIEKAQAVIDGRETPDSIMAGQRIFLYKELEAGSSLGHDRWALLSRALLMASNSRSRWQAVMENAFSIVTRARDLLPRSAFAIVRTELSALGPPTLEEIFDAAARTS